MLPTVTGPAWGMPTKIETALARCLAACESSGPGVEGPGSRVRWLGLLNRCNKRPRARCVQLAPICLCNTTSGAPLRWQRKKATRRDQRLQIGSHRGRCRFAHRPTPLLICRFGTQTETRFRSRCRVGAPLRGGRPDWARAAHWWQLILILSFGVAGVHRMLCNDNVSVKTSGYRAGNHHKSRSSGLPSTGRRPD